MEESRRSSVACVVLLSLREHEENSVIVLMYFCIVLYYSGPYAECKTAFGLCIVLCTVFLEPLYFLYLS